VAYRVGLGGSNPPPKFRNFDKVPKIKKMLLYEMKFLVPNYSCVHNPWLGGHCPQIPVLSVLNWICWTLGSWVSHCTVLWLLELQIRCLRKVWTRVRVVNRDSRTANFQCSLISKKNKIIRIFCISKWLAVPITPNKWSSTVQGANNGIGENNKTLYT
jgi:hypothetical protein